MYIHVCVYVYLARASRTFARVIQQKGGTCIHICMCVYIYTYTYMYICINAYIHTCVHIHTCIYV